ncbi:MAG: glycoside hydrolase family 2, partial [Planctomycetaceae bacterium]|nr:glycoside hydrolase family 2 [Planctomycetaceae bacterium]
MHRLFRSLILGSLAAAALPTFAAGWKPATNTMLTKWGESLDPEAVWKEYPRPQLKRPQWTNLNGLWDYAITPGRAEKPGAWKGKILVPFAVEAPLSGVGHLLKPVETLWYRNTFELAAKPSGRLILHFEAVDHRANVWINGKKAGEHVGGNLPFDFDITDHVKAGGNEIVV